MMFKLTTQIRGKVMLKMIKILAAVSTLAVVTACGGGGGGAAPVASTSAFPLHDIHVSSYITTSSANFTVSGTVNSYSVTGSGTRTEGAVSAGTFESVPALQRTSTITGSINVNSQTVSLASSEVAYVDSNYNLLGVDGSQYIVVTSSNALPNAAHVNDTGTWYVANRYPSSAKASLSGTRTVTYVLEADTATTALLTLIGTDKDIGGTTVATSTEQYRITPAGTYTNVKQTAVKSGSNLVITF
jgi:hypothetical protein